MLYVALRLHFYHRCKIEKNLGRGLNPHNFTLYPLDCASDSSSHMSSQLLHETWPLPQVKWSVYSFDGNIVTRARRKVWSTQLLVPTKDTGACATAGDQSWRYKIRNSCRSHANSSALPSCSYQFAPFTQRRWPACFISPWASFLDSNRLLLLAHITQDAWAM